MISPNCSCLGFRNQGQKLSVRPFVRGTVNRSCGLVKFFPVCMDDISLCPLNMVGLFLLEFGIFSKDRAMRMLLNFFCRVSLAISTEIQILRLKAKFFFFR